MKDYSNDDFIQSVRFGIGVWTETKEDRLIPILYEDMSDKYIKNVIGYIESKKRHYRDIADELDEKIAEMKEYLNRKNIK